jgi:hypothetical protein
MFNTRQNLFDMFEGSRYIDPTLLNPDTEVLCN